MPVYYTLVGIMANGRHKVLVDCAEQPGVILRRIKTLAAPVGTKVADLVFTRFIAFESGGFVCVHDAHGNLQE